MSGLASKAWSALRPTYSVATALNRQLCTTAAVERRHKDFIGNRQAKLTLQGRDSQEKKFVEKFVEIYYTRKMEILE